LVHYKMNIPDHHDNLISIEELSAKLATLIEECVVEIQGVEMFFERMSIDDEGEYKLGEMIEGNFQAIQSLDLTVQILADISSSLSFIAKAMPQKDSDLLRGSLLLCLKLGRIRTLFGAQGWEKNSIPANEKPGDFDFL
jgi:hypothetical protein